MKRTIQVQISRGEHRFVAECLDLPVVTQASTWRLIVLLGQGLIAGHPLAVE